MKLFNRICRPAICGLALAALVAIPSVLRADGTELRRRRQARAVSARNVRRLRRKAGRRHGAPVVFVYQDTAKGINQEIKFCCPMCKPDFLKDPDKYMKIIQAAEAKVKAKDAKN